LVSKFLKHKGGVKGGTREEKCAIELKTQKVSINMI
jgi:hypothetical protein